MSDFDAFEKKMKADGLSQAAIDSFARSYETLVTGHTGMIPENDITPAADVADWESIMAATKPADAPILAKTVCIKLNGGLGTSMGLQKAKSLLEIKSGVTFLDVIVRQIQALRVACGSDIPLLFMNSFSTSADTLSYLSKYAAGGFDKAENTELMQNRVPKIDAATLQPVSYPSNPDMEWCPPGHGDIYPALLGSGWLDKLLARGIEYAFVSNSDNLGAQLDTRMLRYFAESKAPFMMEVTRRTAADKKGGHLAVRKSDGQLILREVAQCPDEDVPEFQNIDKHRFFNTNTLWVNLKALKDTLATNGGVLPLPVIKNNKTVNPRDVSSTKVFQLETAMGAAIECFKGAKAVNVPRTRFFPVKTTSDLFMLRSDAVEVSPDGAVALAPARKGVAPLVDLDSKLYKMVDALDSLGEPSLIGVQKLTVRGPWHFDAGAVLTGTVTLENPTDQVKNVPAGPYHA